jgi:hypothetical protein
LADKRLFALGFGEGWEEALRAAELLDQAEDEGEARRRNANKADAQVAADRGGAIDQLAADRAGAIDPDLHRRSFSWP